MLPYKNRLIKKKDFDRVQRTGQFYAQNNLVMKISQNDLDEVRVGFIVSLKFSKKAVERNLMKRQLREIFRNQLKSIKKGTDIVVSTRKRQGEKVKFDKLKGDAEELLKRSQLI